LEAVFEVSYTIQGYVEVSPPMENMT
jgi:hypothetical protein